MNYIFLCLLFVASPIMCDSTDCVILSDFSVKHGTDYNVRVVWNTGVELNVYGFNLYRKTKGSEWEVVNPEVITAKRMGQVIGDKYTYIDRSVSKPNRYTYKLEVLMVDGTSVWSDAEKIRIGR